MIPVGKIKNIVKYIGKINLINGIRFNVFNKRNGLFLPYKNSYFAIHKNAHIIIKNKSTFSFNDRGSPAPFAGLLIMKDGK
jgi:hypothetical protein